MDTLVKGSTHHLYRNGGIELIHKILLDMGQHPTLRQHYENAMKVYEYYSEKALKCHQDGVYRIDLGDIFSERYGQYLSKSFLEDMLAENPNFEHVELIDDELFITVAKQEEVEEPQMCL